jgi:hypothetical protein
MVYNCSVLLHLHSDTPKAHFTGEITNCYGRARKCCRAHSPISRREEKIWALFSPNHQLFVLQTVSVVTVHSFELTLLRSSVRHGTAQQSPGSALLPFGWLLCPLSTHSHRIRHMLTEQLATRNCLARGITDACITDHGSAWPQFLCSFEKSAKAVFIYCCQFRLLSHGRDVRLPGTRVFLVGARPPESTPLQCSAKHSGHCH